MANVLIDVTMGSGAAQNAQAIAAAAAQLAQADQKLEDTLRKRMSQYVDSQRHNMLFQQMQGMTGMGGMGGAAGMRVPVGSSSLWQQAGGMAGMYGGLSGMGMMGRMGLGGMAAAGVMMGAQHMMGSITGMATAAGSQIGTSAQRMQALGEAAPIIGGLVKSFREMWEAVDGTTAALEKQKYAHEQLAMSQQAAFANMREMFGVQSRTFAARATAGGFRAGEGLSAPPEGDILPRLYSHYERGLPAEQQALEARRRGRSALLGQQAYRNEFTRYSENDAQSQLDKVNELQKKLAAARAGEQGLTGDAAKRKKAEIDDLAGKYTANLTEYERRLGHQRELGNKIVEEGIKAIQADSDARKANIASMRNELEILKEREQMARAQAGAVGSMLPGERATALQWMRQLEGNGIESLAPGQRGLIRQAGFGEVIDRLEQQAGERTPELDQMRRIGGRMMGVEYGTTEEMARQKKELQQKISVAVQVDEQKLATAIANELRKHEGLFKEIANRVEVIMAERLRGQQIHRQNAAAP